MRLRKPAPRPSAKGGSALRARVGDGGRGVVTDAVAIGREMVRIPAAIYMRVAELAGQAVLRAWQLLWPLAVAAWHDAGRLVDLGRRVVTPARALAAAAIGAGALLIVSQFADYRSVSIATDQYSDYGLIAPAPEVDAADAASAHFALGVPLGVAAIVAALLALRGRARAAWALLPIGLVVIGISLAVDVPKGLDEGEAAVVFEGAKAQLLGGFWVQLACGVVLTALAPLLARAPRERSPAPARRPATRASRVSVGQAGG